jgi:DtxR family transcriptional regulator, Mn-dependent transcriptional regulator
MNSNLSSTEENYLKAIFKLSIKPEDAVATNAIALLMETSAASVTDMLKRLSDKELIHYEKYKGVRLSNSGLKVATALVRKHRLWETFLVEKLNFSWDEIHDIAEQMEHIQSEELVDRLDAFLGFPKFDPHGDPIPDKEGHFAVVHQLLLSDLPYESNAIIVGVKDHSSSFLQYLEKLGLTLGVGIKILEKIEYDQSLRIEFRNRELIVTHKVANNLYVSPEN